MEREMNLLEIFQVLKKRLGILLIIIIGFTVLGGGLSFFLNERVYTSTTSLIVGEEKEKETDEYNEISGEPIQETVIQYGTATISKQLNKFYSETLKSRSLLEEVIDNLNLEMTVTDLKESISMEVPEDSGSILITVSGSHLKNADEIADEIVTAFTENVFEITNIDRIKTMNSGSEPKITNTVNIFRNTLVFAVAGFVVGAAVVLVVEYLDDSIKSKREIEEKLGISVVGQIRTEETLKEDLKNFRTIIEFSPEFRDKKTIVVTAPDQSYKNISSNLTNVLADADKDVLLMDADFRQPSIHEELGLQNESGLSEFLKGDTSFSDTVKADTTSENYQVLTTGNSLDHPSEQLSSNRMKELLAETRKTFDYIIIKGHSINEVTDTVALSALSDGVILIVEANKTKITEIQKIQQKLSDIEVNILGIVLNES